MDELLKMWENFIALYFDIKGLILVAEILFKNIPMGEVII